MSEIEPRFSTTTYHELETRKFTNKLRMAFFTWICAGESKIVSTQNFRNIKLVFHLGTQCFGFRNPSLMATSRWRNRSIFRRYSVGTKILLLPAPNTQWKIHTHFIKSRVTRCCVITTDNTIFVRFGVYFQIRSEISKRTTGFLSGWCLRNFSCQRSDAYV